jgi:hypothetical protein
MALKSCQADVKALDKKAATLAVRESGHSKPISCPFDPARQKLPSPTENPVKQRARRD